MNINGAAYAKIVEIVDGTRAKECIRNFYSRVLVSSGNRDETLFRVNHLSPSTRIINRTLS